MAKQKRSRARASAKSKALADILSDIELIEQALSDAEERADAGIEAADQGTGSAGGTKTSGSAMERMAAASSTSAMARKGNPLQTIANLINTHNPHGWVRNAMSGNISGSTFQNLGHSVQMLGGNTLGSQLIGAGIAVSPHIAIARFVSDKIKQTMYAAEEHRAYTMSSIASIQERERGFLRANFFRMRTADIVAERQRSIGLQSQVDKASSAELGVVGSTSHYLMDKYVNGAPLERMNIQLRMDSENRIFARENPWVSQQARDSMRYENLRTDVNVLRKLEVRNLPRMQEVWDKFTSDPKGFLSDLVFKGKMPGAGHGEGFLTDENLRNMRLAFWRWLGDPGGIYRNEMAKIVEDESIKRRRTELARKRDALKDFWENPVTGPVHAAQEMERTRWQSAVEEDYIHRFLQWNTA